MNSGFLSIFKREFRSYFASPVAYIFIILFLVMNGVFTFFVGAFYERGQADLTPFFNFHPWIYLVFIPALSMRLWSEERAQGTIELLLTLPITIYQAVLAKFIAAWSVSGIALVLTFPIWLTVNYLGQPDNGVIFASYIASWILAGAFLSVSSLFSACSSNQVVALILSICIGFFFVVAGLPIVLSWFSGWAPNVVIDAVASLSFLGHFQNISKGILDIRDVVYFVVVIAVFLYMTSLIVSVSKAAK